MDKELKQKLKDSILTPKTDFPMRAGLTNREPETLARWYEKDLYGAIRKARAGAEKFVLHDGPPYANGDAHTGTGMNKILKDFVVKFRTMQGYDSPYIPGWDCHGLPIEHKVLEELGGRKPEDMSALELRKRCLAFAEKFIDQQREQFKRTFTLGRWEKPYLTIDPVYEGGVLDCFADLTESGYITRALKPVHWSWAAQSALAEAELEYADRKDPSIYVKFRISGGVGDLKEHEDLVHSKQVDLVIWTTTPWTLPANIAVAVAPDAEYGLYAIKGEEAWIVANDLADKVFEAAGVEGKHLATLRGKDLTTLTYTHCLWDTPEHKVVLADYVTLEDGTGLVHTAPGHGAEDFYTGQKEGLPVVCPVDEHGKYYNGQAFIEVLQLRGQELSDEACRWLDRLGGEHIFKANKIIIEELVKSGQMIHWHEFEHSYPHCWRTKQPVIFRATEQWFVSVDHTPEGESKSLRDRILEQVEASEWFPAWGRKRISGMVQSRPDWCISRQRYWGIPIPAFREPETGKVCAGTGVARRIADVVREHGSDVWFDEENWPADKLLPDEHRSEEFRGKTLERMHDIFDVWFESGASHRGVTAAEVEMQDWEEGDAEKPFRPADIYLEGDDQHRGWFQVSLILATATKGVAPFRQCLTSAFVVDEKGQKGSKSKGNIFAIDWGCEQIGADLLRLYFASVDTSTPIPVTLELVREKTANSYRTLRNTIRMLLGSLQDFDPAQHRVAYNDLQDLDRWALSRTAGVVKDVTALFDKYENHHGMRRLVEWVNAELSSFYIDVTKDSLYCDAADGERRRSTQTAMYEIASALIRMLAPITPHTADEAWQELPGTSEEEWSVHLARWPNAGEGYLSSAPDLEERFEHLRKAVAEFDAQIDPKIKAKELKSSTSLKLTLTMIESSVDEALGAFSAADLATYFNVAEVVVVPYGSHDATAPNGSTARVLFDYEESGYGKCQRSWIHRPDVKARDDLAGLELSERDYEVLKASW